MKHFFSLLSAADLGVYPAPFTHQIEALEAAVAGKDVFVSTGTGSGKTECFLWPLLAKLAAEAYTSPETWEKRGVRAILLYPMNALVSDQLSRRGVFCVCFAKCAASLPDGRNLACIRAEPLIQGKSRILKTIGSWNVLCSG